MATAPFHVFGNGVGFLNRQDLDDNFSYVPQWQQTAAEIAAGVIPTNTGYQPGDVRRYGADPTGVADSALAFTNAFKSSNYVYAESAVYRINSTIVVPSFRMFSYAGSTITLFCGATPFLSFTGANACLHVFGGGGVVNGTASAFLFAQGSTDSPVAIGQYARFIYLNACLVSSATIASFLIFDKAVNTVVVNECSTSTVNGVSASGKCVDVNFSNCTIFGQGIAASFGIKLRSTGGGSFYNEGWAFVNCTIDGFAVGHDITDIFVYKWSGCYMGCAAAGVVAQFSNPSTTHANPIRIGGESVIAGPINFVSSGGFDYQASITDCTFINGAGANISIGNNSAGIEVSDCDFVSSTAGVAVVGVSNNANIILRDLKTDSTFAGGVQLNGANGAGCLIDGIKHGGSGAAINAGRPMVLRNISADSVSITALQSFNPATLGGSYLAGAIIATVTGNFGAGERGYINVSCGCAGMNAGTQTFRIDGPAGMVFPQGTGWTSQFILPGVVAGQIVRQIPYYMSADAVAGSVTLTNTAGNTVSIDSHSFFGFVRGGA